jgi:hypothetical protein
MLQNGMGRFTGKPRNKSHAAGVKVETGVDKTVPEIGRPLIADMAVSLFHESSIFRRG